MSEKDNKKRINVQSTIVPYICQKCGKGKMEKKCDGRVYVCSNPECGIAFWINYGDIQKKITETEE